ncbi:hypothetical protein ThidrDRAFT_2667 [Thiorhodococcus drewsii AZ1]|uniref:Uncharacterized protein n=1 Tax=Thiorhodococcus drewsii AZ1 TaxID=765913 RepID=G2E304_9GAMM|nr:hypothetical protein ThidrDRAFT_2667 [Thiorhodococcus drewsii AZ1]
MSVLGWACAEAWAEVELNTLAWRMFEVMLSIWIQ